MSLSRRRVVQRAVAGLVLVVVMAGLVSVGRTVDVESTPRPSPGPTCTPTPVEVFLPRVRRAEMPTVRPTVGPPATVRPTVEVDG